MKKAIVVLLFAAGVYAAEGGGGRLFVHLTAGFDVIVDGNSYGQTTVEQGGKMVDLPAGPHHVVVRSAEGREGSFDVTIAAGETRDVTLSPLGLRKKLAPPSEGTAGVLNVLCIPDSCKLDFKQPLEAVQPGRHALAVTNGTKTLKLDVEVPENTIVTVEANFNAGTIRTISSRPKPRRLAVTEANDALSRLAIPPFWKTAIRGALPAGIGIEAAGAQGNAVRVTLRVPSAEVGNSMLAAVIRSNAFEDVSAPGAPRPDKTGWLFDLIFYFSAR